MNKQAMSKTILYIATSLDNKIANNNYPQKIMTEVDLLNDHIDEVIYLISRETNIRNVYSVDSN